MFFASPFDLKKSHRNPAKSFRPRLESTGERLVALLCGRQRPGRRTAFTGAMASKQLVITFDGPLNAGPAQDACELSGHQSPGEPGAGDHERGGGPVVSASYSDASASQVTLTLRNSLKPGAFYRIFVNGTPASMSVNPASNPLTDINGVLFDGDNDDTPGGDFYGLFAAGTKLSFMDSNGDRCRCAVKGGGEVNVWRELDGDIDQLSVVGPARRASTLTGSVRGEGEQSNGVHWGGDDSRRRRRWLSTARPTPAGILRHAHAAAAAPCPSAHGRSPSPSWPPSQNLPYTLASRRSARPPRLAAGRSSRPIMLRRRPRRISRWAMAHLRRPDQRLAQFHTERRDQLPARLPERRHHRHQSRELAKLVHALEPDGCAASRSTTR